MFPNATIPAPDVVVYPESDGLPMADNTRQFRWIFVLFGNLAALFRDAKDVFVGGDLFWYPVEGQPDVRMAPDVLVAFGRPKRDRGSYRQWEENNVPLTVVFEVLSPNNSFVETDRRLLFYTEHGVEEYYLYDPDSNHLMIYLRQGTFLQRVRSFKTHTSPRLGIRFDLTGPEMVVYRPDGQRFLSFEELSAAREQEKLRADRAEEKATAADKRAEQAAQRAARAEQRVSRLGQLSRKARTGQATPEELQELERLEEPPATGSP